MDDRSSFRRTAVSRGLMTALWPDMRVSLRTLARRPLASLAVAGILACAIAAATVLGTLFAALVYDVPPVEAPDTIVRIRRADHDRPAGHREPSAADVLAWRASARTLTALTAWRQRQVIVGGADGRTVSALVVTPEYFRVIGRPPLRGRPFAEEDVGRAEVVIISERLWRDRFNGDPAVIGQRLPIDARGREIVGVMPADFWFPSRGIEVWLPFPLESDESPVDSAGLLIAGATTADAQAELDVLVQQGAGRGAARGVDRALVQSVAADARVKMGPALQGLVAPAIAILLIACANIGNLLIMRTVLRERELAIRAAIGATRPRLARMIVVETAILTAVGGVLGLLLASWGVALLRIGVARAMPPQADLVRFGPETLAVAVLATAVSLAATAAFPVCSAVRRDLSRVLARRSPRLLSRRFHYTAADLLIVLQVGLGVILVLVSVMLVRSFAEIDRLLHPAIDPQPFVARVVTPADLDRDARSTLYHRVLDAVDGVEGVEAAALASALPLTGSPAPVVIAGGAVDSSACELAVGSVSRGYFETLGVRLESGVLPRTIGGESAVVSAAAARTCWGASTPQEWRLRMRSGPSVSWLPVVGVVADPRPQPPPHLASLRIGTPSFAWIVGPREWPSSVYLVVRPRRGSVVSTATLARAVGAASADVAMESFVRLDARLDATRQRAGSSLTLALLAIVALIALILAATGVYAAFSQSCSVRLGDIGTRLALGANRRQLAMAAFARDLPLVVTGIVAGVTGTLWVVSVVWRDLLMISGLDPAVWIVVGGVLAAAGLPASMGPVLRAINVDPMTVLRAE